MLSLLFWQFANEITKVDEAKRFYCLYALIGQTGMVIAGYVGMLLSDNSVNTNLTWDTIIANLTSCMLVSSVVLMILYRWINRTVLTDKKYFEEAESYSKEQKPKVKLSVMESLKYIFQSKYIGLMRCL